MSITDQPRSNRRRLCYWVVLPAYNEEQSLPQLLNRIAEALDEAGGPYRIIVVNDGSTDSTARVATESTLTMPVLLENHPVNMGLGATLRDGLLKAIELAHPEDIVVTMDADNSHNPGLIPRMGGLIREGNDVAIASRYQAGSRVRGVPLYRRMLSRVASVIFRLIFPIHGVRDYTCGYRAYRVAALKLGVERFGDRMFDQQGFQCIVDILLKLRTLHLSFIEVPMVLRYDWKEGASKMKVARTIQKTLVLLVQRRLGR
jgi:dolichol-phosphate mannosyltransferase